MFAILQLSKVFSIVLAGIVFLVLSICLFVVGLYFDTRAELKRNAKPMFNCPIHGIYPKEYTVYLDLPPDENNKELKIPMCPLCFKENADQKVKSNIIEMRDRSVS